MASQIENLFADGGADTLLEQLGETVTQYPLGVQGNAVAMTAIVDLGAEGAEPLNDEHGTQRVRWCELTLPASVVVTISERTQQRDQFLVRGLLWHAEEIPRENAALQTVRLRRTEGVSSKKTRQR